MPIDPNALYQQLGTLVSTAPDLNTSAYTEPTGMLWLGRAAVLIEATGDAVDSAAFKAAANGLGTPFTHGDHARTIMSIVYRALARAELAAPAAAQGAYLPVGEPLAAVAAISKALASSTSSALFVDPYADANLVTDFAALTTEGVGLMVLADAAGVKPGLKPAAKAWIAQYGATRPLEVRVAAGGSLHDRMIILDDKQVWLLGQSFNALAKRSPTALQLASPDTASLKIDGYKAIWQNATPL